MTPIALFYWRASGQTDGQVRKIFTASDLTPEVFPKCVEGQLLFLAGHGLFGDMRRQVEAVEDAHSISVQVSEFIL